MEFSISIFFLLFYYIRPQDWLPGLAGANLVKPILGIWLLALLTKTPRNTTIQGLLRTPHDWVLLIYYLYAVFTSSDATGTAMGLLPLMLYYVFTVQSISTWEQLYTYLKWWIGILASIAVIALLSLYGVDFTGAQEVTESMAGRLCIGTWLHNNPNALGHSVIVIIAASYFLYFWRGTPINRFLTFPLLSGLAYFCAWNTESKGAFLVGGVLISLIFVIGRPKFVQVLALITTLTLGVSALSFLPRMSDMQNLGADQGVQGRLLAWEQARTVAHNETTGVGWAQFRAYIDWKEGNKIYHDIPKATHSSYVQIAADLGSIGLFIYLAAIWTALHTLLAFKPSSDIEDRCRRVLLILVIANVLSGWMINRQYHSEYFLLIAATAALHRMRKAEENSGQVELETDDKKEYEPTGPISGTPALAFSTKIPISSIRPLWNRFNLADIVICLGLTWLTFWTWDYVLTNL